MQNKSFSGLDRMRPITLFGIFYGQTFLHKGTQKKRFKLAFPANAAGNQHWEIDMTRGQLAIDSTFIQVDQVGNKHVNKPDS